MTTQGFPPNPFPMTYHNYDTGKDFVVIDELCACGGLWSAHNHTFGWGHGDCPPTDCVKFTWVDFVKEGE